MNNWILLAIAMIANLSVSTLRKVLMDRGDGSKYFLNLTNMMASLVSAIGLAATAGNLQVSGFTFALGLLFGAIVASQMVTYMKALEVGPFSYTVVICSLSLLIPTLSGALIWGERITGLQILGVVLIVICLLLSVEPDSGEKKATAKWLIYCGLACLMNGLIGVVQKWHQTSVHKDELDMFLVIAFVFCMVYSLAEMLLQVRKSGSQKPALRVKWGLILMMLAIGAATATAHKVCLYLSGVMESSVFFPVVNGGGLVLTTLLGLILFREKLSKRKWTGIVIGILAVLCLCI